MSSGHLLLNGNAALEGGRPASESSDTTNLMFRAGTESASDLDDVGQKLSATVGGHDIIEHRKDGAKEAQIFRMHANGRGQQPGFVHHANNNATHGDMADFDWVSDHRLIETLEGGGNGADHTAASTSSSGRSATSRPAAQGAGERRPAHGGFGTLALGKFADEFFKTIDVISNINLFADNDINTATGMVSDRSKALDYFIPDFSLDGINWVAGELVNVFIKGWTEATTQENYVGRFRTDLEAKFVRISAVGVGHRRS